MAPKFLVSTLATAVALSFSATAIAKDTSNKEQRFEQITVIGSEQAINDIPLFQVFTCKKKTAMVCALILVCVALVLVVTIKYR